MPKAHFELSAFSYSSLNGFFSCGPFRIQSTMIIPTIYKMFTRTTLIISKKPGNTGISRDIRTEFTTDLLLSD